MAAAVMRTTRSSSNWQMQVQWCLVLCWVVLLLLVLAVLGKETMEKKSSSGASTDVTESLEVYMVLVSGQPVVAYKGGLSDLNATAQLFTRRWKSRHRTRYGLETTKHAPRNTFESLFLQVLVLGFFVSSASDLLITWWIHCPFIHSFIHSW
jgi:uncharacterized SAM-binding protein YcdF (DUF218 family)